MGSFAFYRKAADNLGMDVVEVKEMTPNLIKHYGCVHDELVMRKTEINEHISEAYINRMLTGLNHWIKVGNEGQLSWGTIHLRKR